jgi:acetyltransferase-like isoleucine patch superfamily enzyme
MSEKAFIHPTALVETDSIGQGSRVWAFAHVMKNVVIGSGCNVGDHSFIESGVSIGDNVTIKNGVSIWDGVTIEGDVFVGPNACFTNDTRPRSKVYHSESERTIIARGASIGANATVLSGLRVGTYALVGAGSVVTRDVKDFELVYGNPVQHKGWVGRNGESLAFEHGVALVGLELYRLHAGGRVTLEIIQNKTHEL